MRMPSFIPLLTFCKIDAYQKGTRSREGVMCLTARERVLMIRLMEKLEKHPTYAKTLGIEAAGAVNNQNMESDPKGLTST